MEGKLMRHAAWRALLGAFLMGALLFVPAGTLQFWQAWLLLFILFVPMIPGALVLGRKNPGLLQKRLDLRERQAQQKAVVAGSGALLVITFLLAGFGVRFSWPALPAWASGLGAGVFLAAYALYAQVLRENTFLSRVVEVQENQRVIDTGLYGVVRHPMYLSATLISLSIPLVLGSPGGCLVMLLYLPLMVVRIRGEERLLRAELEGYEEYCARVRWRMIPLIW